MKDQDFQEFLDERYKPAITWYDTKSKSFQKKYRIKQWAIIILSSLTPILILADYVFLDYFYILLPASLVSAVAVAILSSALTTFKYYDNWINYRTICETLKKEKYLYNAEIDEYSSVEDKKALFVQRVEALISRENTLWVTTFKKSEEKVNS